METETQTEWKLVQGVELGHIMVTDGIPDKMDCLKCYSIDFYSILINGNSLNDSICDDDVAWYVPEDLIFLDMSRITG